MNRCAVCGDIAVAAVKLTVEYTLVWDWAATPPSSLHEVGLCEPCANKLAAGHDLDASLNVEVVP